MAGDGQAEHRRAGVRRGGRGPILARRGQGGDAHRARAGGRGRVHHAVPALRVQDQHVVGG